MVEEAVAYRLFSFMRRAGATARRLYDVVAEDSGFVVCRKTMP